MRSWIFRVAALTLLCIVPLGAEENPVPLVQAHSHNDYMRARPLLDALDLGFCSVEADIHLVEGELLVAHDRDQCDPSKTLQKLYLDPLREQVKKNGGHVYPNGPRFLLLIDIKSNAEKTYRRLHEILQDYAGMLTVFRDDATDEGAVTVLISGNRPMRLVWSLTPRLAAVDGRPPDLDKDINRHKIPLISSSWESLFAWRGEGPIPPEEGARLRDMGAKTHARGQLLRFWALPVRPPVWPELYDAGVDLLNADNIAGLRDFLLEQLEKK